jgi:hypothetical protein
MVDDKSAKLKTQTLNPCFAIINVNVINPKFRFINAIENQSIFLTKSTIKKPIIKRLNELKPVHLRA